MTLSRYQNLFLRHMFSYEVALLVVGGQAKRLCKGEPCYDLDLWANYSKAARPLLLSALSSWVEKHPSHTPPSTLDNLPTHLRNGIQIKFPEYDGVWFLEGSKEYQVDVNSGVDLIIEGGTEPNFAVCAARAKQVFVETGLTVKCLSPEDDLLLRD